jgi:hypothetical protein
MSYERMLKTEAELTEEIEKLLEQAEQVDGQEDALYGEKNRGTELPEELRRRESRLSKIREAKASLEAEAARARALELAEQAATARQKAEQLADGAREKAAQAAAKAESRARSAKAKAVEKADERVAQARGAAEAAAAQAETPAARRCAGAAKQAQEAAERDRARVTDDDDEPPPAGTGAAFPEHRVPSDADGNPKPTAQRNFTDADSRIMKKGSDYIQGYNCQLAVDEAHQIIVACEVTNQAPDVEHLPPMLDAIEQNCGVTPERLTADSGYFSEENVGACEQKSVDGYIAVGRQKHGTPETTPAAESESKAKMRQKLTTPEGRKIYSRRKAVVEPVNGQIKEARGFRGFLLRGIDKVRSEWAVICATHNLLKLYRAGKSGKTMACAATLAAAR